VNAFEDLPVANGVIVSWPWGVPYLTREAIARTLGELPRYSHCAKSVGDCEEC
jgi:hypothetical protein